MRQIKHNPAFLSDDDLQASFVVRERSLDALLEFVNENTAAKAAQHVLVLAPRGFGKTTLVRRLDLAVRRDPKLNERWFPIIFAEESYAVGSAGELWLEALRHLGNATGDSKWARLHDKLLGEPDEQRLQDRALARLLDFADDAGKRLLLVVENLDMIFSEQIDGNAGWELRHTLQGEPRIMLLATAVLQVEELTRSDHAMYDLFRTVELEPLDEAECGTVWAAVSGSALVARQARAVQILTGGNPRLLSILASFSSGHSLGELMGNLAELVDEHTNYFKSNLDALPAVERKSYVALADLWKPSSAAEVGRRARLSSSKTSALLGRLAKRGMVTVARTQGRTKYYRVAERLYNIYHLMRCRGGAEQRVRAVVEFMVSFYGPDELAGLLAEIARESLRLPGDERRDHFTALDQVIERSPHSDLLLTALPQILFEEPDLPDGLQRHVQDPERLRALLRHSPDDGDLWERLALALFAQPEHQEAALKAAREALQLSPDSLLASIIAAILTNDRSALERQFQRVSETRKPRIHLALAGVLLFDEEVPHRLELAEEHLTQAAEAVSGNPELWRVRGEIRMARANAAGARDDYRRALELGGKSTEALVGLAKAQQALGSLEEAAQSWQQAAELKPEDGSLWAQSADAWAQVEQWANAEAAYRKALDLNPTAAQGWMRLADLLEERGERAPEVAATLLEGLHHNPGFFPLSGRLLMMTEGDGEGREHLRCAARDRLRRDADDKAGLWATIWLQKGNDEEATQTSRHLLSLLAADSPFWPAFTNALIGLVDSSVLLEAAEHFAQVDEGLSTPYGALFALQLTTTKLPQLWAHAARMAEALLPDPLAHAALAWANANLGSGEVAIATLGPVLLADELAVPPQLLTEVLIAAATTAPDAVSTLLQRSPHRLHFEPILAALALLAGCPADVSEEVLKVGEDVAERIEQRSGRLAYARTHQEEAGLSTLSDGTKR